LTLIVKTDELPSLLTNSSPQTVNEEGHLSDFLKKKKEFEIQKKDFEKT
jgi:hypothetical protein